MDFKGKKVGLALGGGAARGWAHIGAIMALQDAGIHFHCIAGTSIGALVGALVAADRLEVLRDFVLSLDKRRVLKLMDWVFPRAGLLRGNRITNYVCGMADCTTIEELPTPYCAIATAIDSGQEIMIDHGDLMNAVRASISVPGLMIPFANNGSILVDGGLVNPVPVSATRKMGAEVVIAVDLSHDIPVQKSNHIRQGETDSDHHWLSSLYELKIFARIQKRLNKQGFSLGHHSFWPRPTAATSLPSIRDVMVISTCIMEASITQARLQLDPPELLIRPKLAHIGFMEFYRAEEAIAEGYRAAQAALEALATEIMPGLSESRQIPPAPR
jgi:NTE family protein